MHFYSARNMNRSACLALFAILFIGAPAFGDDSSRSDKKEKIKISIDIYSGRENPSFTLDEDDPDAVAVMRKITEAKMKVSTDKDSMNIQGYMEEETPKLGYRGMMIRKKSKKPGYTEYIYIRNSKIKIIEDNSTTQDFTTQELSRSTGEVSAANDPNREIENNLIDLAVQKGVVERGFNVTE